MLKPAAFSSVTPGLLQHIATGSILDELSLNLDSDEMADSVALKSLSMLQKAFRDGDLAARFALAILVMVIAGLIFVVTDFKHESAAVLWALACLALGALVGFLFGIPRILQNGALSNADHANAGSYQLLLNTNLEQLSDWLTKIIVGVGLVEMRRIPPMLQDCADYIAPGLGTQDSGTAMSLILYFPVCGFLSTYIIMRLYLTRAFSEADQRSQHRLSAQELGDALARAIDDAATADSPPSSKDIANAKMVAKVATDVDDATLINQIQDLAHEYDVEVAQDPQGTSRNVAVQGVFTQMKALGQTIKTRDLLAALTTDQSPSKRLIAIACLQLAPDESYLSWLTQQVKNDDEFIGSQAAIALQVAATAFVSHRPALQQLIVELQKTNVVKASSLISAIMAKTLERIQ